MSEDEELVQALIEGREGAAKRFLNAYSRLIYGLARGKFRLSQADADDFFQALWLHLTKDNASRLLQWDRRGEFGAFLRKVATNLLIDQHRGSERNLEDCVLEEEDAVTFADTGPTPEAAAMHGQMRSAISGCMERLSNKAAEVVELHHAHGLLYREIADSIGMSVSNVGVTLLRAEKALRDCLTQHLGQRAWLLSY